MLLRAVAAEERAVSLAIRAHEPLLVALGILVTAALVNRFARDQRHQIRRLAILFALYLFGLFLVWVAARVGATAFHQPLVVAVWCLHAFCIVAMSVTLTFDVALRALRMRAPPILSDIVSGVGYVVSVLWALSRVGVDPSSIAATSAVLGAALTLSLQATLGNLLGGIAIQLDRSLEVGDWISLENGKQGLVKAIRWRHTVVETRDWDTIIVPNSALLAASFSILGKREGRNSRLHRMWVHFLVDFRYSPSEVIDVITEALRFSPIDGVAQDPPPDCICFDFARDRKESAAYYAVRYWLTDLHRDDPTSSTIRRRIYAALRRAGIPLARPSQVLSLESEQVRGQERQDERRSVEKALRSLDLFASFQSAEVEHLAKHAHFVPYTDGETITKQGAVAHWLYILAKGTVEVRASLGGGFQRPVARIEAPGFFGEMGLLLGEPRQADVVAVSHVECYRIDKETFELIVRDRPEVAQEVSETLAKRRVGLSEALEDLDETQRLTRRRSEQSRILGSMRKFFGLDGPERSTLY